MGSAVSIFFHENQSNNIRVLANVVSKYEQLREENGGPPDVDDILLRQLGEEVIKFKHQRMNESKNNSNSSESKEKREKIKSTETEKKVEENENENNEKKIKFLIVDDSSISCRLASHAVKRLGHESEIAIDGNTALNILHEKDSDYFDLVLLDIVMPGMDGVQVLSAIKNDDDLKHLDVIMLSSIEDPMLTNTCMAQGAIQVLMKPLKVQLVKKIIADYDARKKQLLNIPKSPKIQTIENKSEEEKIFPPEPEQNNNSKEEEKRVNSIRNPGRISILVVDDSNISSKLAVRKLSTRGYDTMHAENGQLAINLLREYPHDFDIVLLDIVMPVMDGIEVLKIIKSDPILQDLPVAMMSGIDDESLAKVCLDEGAGIVLKKPLSMDKIDKLIDDLELKEHLGIS